MKQSIRQNKMLLAVTLLFSIITSAAGVLVAIILQKVIDAAMQGDMLLFKKILILSVAYLLLLSLFGFIYAICSKALIRNLTLSLRERVFRGVFRRNAEEFTSSNTADYLSALTNDIKLLEDNYIQPLLLTLQNVVVFASSLIALLYLSPLVTLILVVCMILMFAVPSLFGKALQDKQSAVSARMSIFTTSVKDLLSGYEVIKSYAMGKHTEQKFQQENTAAANTRFAADRLFAANESLSETLAILTQFSVVFIAAYLIISGDFSAGSLVALVQLSGGFVGPVLVVMQNLPKIQGVKPVVQRINDLASEEAQLKSGLLEPVFNENLEVSHLQFAYQQGNQVLSDINLSLQKGKKYALVGRSGCGKSTLVKLLSGYYDRYEGSITLDGINLKQLDPEQLQQMTATIHQNVYMFDTDIKQNICLHEEFSEEVMETALRTSGVHKFVEKMPSGLLTTVGENGSQLSGGQRQRIAVARALIRSKPILILDEGTSAIDMQTAYEIESRLLTLKELTLITITHNMNEGLLGLYDEIIYMENGRIAEVGSFQELRARGGGFAAFCSLHKGDVAEALQA
ncbi:ABC transporter permease [Paenibacillus sp. FSL H7-0357]|uniref:ABC transporter ATP-binding protein n=1 Tax=Paenibacillus sp. FSL H7-0357 TaxID=1536774 RepID=UPI0004F8EF75|nr:ABC transporter ATP-binding protein [Paenibacillus sp. FSL H7-0357]AIQ18242.1 ABC transporter permease [Paenibacillus sp. FSL H7-0357]